MARLRVLMMTDGQYFAICFSAVGSVSLLRLICSFWIEDLRQLPLLRRKALLKKLIRGKGSRILYLNHVETNGRLLFDKIIAMDLEGTVAKRKDSPYTITEKPSRFWIKVKNPRYSQLEGREELFERA
jgi:ATP dependent DNA ligase domain